MTKAEALHLSNVIRAYGENKTIQVRIDNQWCDVTSTDFSFDAKPFEYRIKPEQKFRPYANKEEFFKACKIHGPYIKGPTYGYDGLYNIPRSVTRSGVIWTTYKDSRSSWEELSHCVWQDGTPCSILEK